MFYYPEVECPKCGKEDVPYFESYEFDAWGPGGKSRTYDKGRGDWKTKCCDAIVEDYEPEFDIDDPFPE